MESTVRRLFLTQNTHTYREREVEWEMNERKITAKGISAWNSERVYKLMYNALLFRVRCKSTSWIRTHARTQRHTHSCVCNNSANANKIQTITWSSATKNANTNTFDASKEMKNYATTLSHLCTVCSQPCNEYIKCGRYSHMRYYWGSHSAYANVNSKMRTRSNKNIVLLSIFLCVVHVLVFAHIYIYIYICVHRHSSHHHTSFHVFHFNNKQRQHQRKKNLVATEIVCISIQMCAIYSRHTCTHVKIKYHATPHPEKENFKFNRF